VRTVRTVAELRSALSDLRHTGGTVGLVITQPTMGHLHDGHLSLVRRAREVCDATVVMLFLSSHQPDWARDPDGCVREVEQDVAAAAAAGADLLLPRHERRSTRPASPPKYASEASRSRWRVCSVASPTSMA
jgi:pantoate--beta-alanine ligase